MGSGALYLENTKIPSVMYEMLRSFVVVADTLNITRAVETLGVTRQTIRRHLDDLEELLSVKLFTINSRQYQITEQGEQYLSGANTLLRNLDAWVENGSASNVASQSAIDHNKDEPFFYFGQQHELIDVWQSGVPLLREGITAWTTSCGQFEHPALEKVKPYLLIFRRNRDRWLCTFVGEQSSYATWLGPTWARSAIGSSIEEDAANPKDTAFVIEAYNWVNETGSPRYDHVYGTFAREEGGETMPVGFQRLVFPSTLPDGARIIGVLVARSNRIEINAINPSDYVATPQEALMEFEI